MILNGCTLRAMPTLHLAGSNRSLAALMTRRAVPLIGLTAAAAVLVGCRSVGPVNPAVRVSASELKVARETMVSNPVELDRPVLVLSGYRSPATNARRLTSRVRSMTSGKAEDFHTVVYMFGDDIHEIAARVVREVQERWPSDSPDETVEVDVLGISMGGLVARHAALASDDRPARLDSSRAEPTRRLKVRRLFTYGSPHQGSILARRIAIDPAAKAMKPGSVYLGQLNSKWPETDYELIPYAQLNDTWVGATRTAPPGEVPLWDRGQVFFSHFLVPGNPLFVADTARRLRGEQPLIVKGEQPPRD